MAQDTLRKWFRSPPDLVARIQRSARQNDRTDSAEIRHRLERDMRQHPPDGDDG